MKRRSAILAAAGLLAASGCASDSSADSEGDSVQVVAAFYPLQFAAEQVAGDLASVTGLAPPGVEAHDLELSPSQVVDIAEADLVIYLSDFQPAVDEAVAEHAAHAVDVAEVVPLLDASGEDGHEGEGEDGHEDHDHEGEDHAGEGEGDHSGEGENHAGEGEHGDHEGHDHGSADPHLWLDPQRMDTVVHEIADQLGTLDSAHAGTYADRATQVGEQLGALDTEYVDGLAECERREFVVSHAAFGYLAERYDLAQISIAGLSPEDEPTPQRLADVSRQAEEHGATTIFFEVLVSSRVAEVIADQTGARTEVLDPIEGLAPDSEEDYFSLMRTNLDKLRTALGCT